VHEREEVAAQAHRSWLYVTLSELNHVGKTQHCILDALSQSIFNGHQSVGAVHW